MQKLSICVGAGTGDWGQGVGGQGEVKGGSRGRSKTLQK